MKRIKNPTKTPWGFRQNPPPPGFFKLNSPWGMGVGTPWGPRGVWGWYPNPTQCGSERLGAAQCGSMRQRKST